MNEITTIGLDLAKQVFHVVGCDARGKGVKRKRLRGGLGRADFANLAACVGGMGAWRGGGFWAR
ncbi:MAG: IS110 family transposase, partial [Thiotrichales bacterium]|nr:IS110 family transposase [Thiotrichales bacterium]